jgi:Flp pilus assembly protein TadD
MPVTIFFSYAHKDEQLLIELKKHLSTLKQSGLINIWHDRDISAGTYWEQQIKIHLNEAQIILLLISSDFMDSDYCNGVEMQQALERHDLGKARVIPIILRYVSWKEGVLGKLQALPKDGIPVKSWPDQDEALYNVTEGIRKVIEEIAPKSSPSSSIQSTQQVLQTPLPTNHLDTSQKMKEQWLEEGDRLYGLKRYSEALATYERAIQLDSNYATAYNNKGRALMRLKRYVEALTACEQAIQLDSNYATAYNNKSWALIRLKRYVEALTACEQAIQLDSNYVGAYNNKSWALIRLKRYEEAIAACERAISLDPNYAPAYNNKGWAFNRMKRYQDGLAACEQAIILDPNLAVAYQNKGKALTGLDRKAEAQKAYEKARQLGYRA